MLWVNQQERSNLKNNMNTVNSGYNVLFKDQKIDTE